LNAAGAKNTIILDSIGVIAKSRRDLNSRKKELLKFSNTSNISGQLSEAIGNADVFIGVSKPGVLTSAMIGSMKPDPIIFAMANPVPEIMPNEARKAGAAIVATGRSDFDNQINNVLVFPGFFRGTARLQSKEG
jgi:malate dehydrogenase (oxaloacetate-decarboxylating)